MEHYALVGNKTHVVSGMAAPAYRKKNTRTAICVVGKGVGSQGNWRNTFSQQMNSHPALLSAQKATKTIISALHLRPLQLGWLKGIPSQSTASEGQTLR